MRHKISGVTGPKFTKIVAVVIFSSTVLTQPSMLRSVNQLSIDRGDIKKKVTSVKHKLAGGIAIAGGLIMRFFRQTASIAADLLAAPASQIQRMFFLCGTLTAGRSNRLKQSREMRVFFNFNKHVYT